MEDVKSSDVDQCSSDRIEVQSGCRDAAEAEALLGRLHWLRGETDQVFPHLEAAEALVEVLCEPGAGDDRLPP